MEKLKAEWKSEWPGESAIASWRRPKTDHGTRAIRSFFFGVIFCSCGDERKHPSSRSLGHCPQIRQSATVVSLSGFTFRASSSSFLLFTRSGSVFRIEKERENRERRTERLERGETGTVELALAQRHAHARCARIYAHYYRRVRSTPHAHTLAATTHEHTLNNRRWRSTHT